MNHGLRPLLITQDIISGVIVVAVAFWVMSTWNFRAAVAAELLIAFDLPSIVMANEVMAETVFQALVMIAAALALTVSTYRAGRLRLVLLTGLLAGAALLTRPTGIVLPFLLPIPFLIRKLELRVRLRDAALVLVIPLIMGVAWSARNYMVAGYPGLSTVGAINMYYYRAADVVARRNGTILAAARDSFGKQLGVPFERIFQANVQSAQLVNRMNRSAFRILVTHPREVVLMTVQASAYLAVAPMRSPVAAMMGTPGATAGDGLNAGAPSLGRLRTTLRTILLSPLLSGVVLMEAALTLVLWTGLGLAWIRMLSAKSDYRLWVLFLSIAGLLLMLLGAGGDADTRFRCPAVPLLATVAALGYFPGWPRHQRVTSS
jgi:4-amino-4-deoxy-L-arabinose transferase-like glycosyltransferase